MVVQSALHEWRRPVEMKSVHCELEVSRRLWPVEVEQIQVVVVRPRMHVGYRIANGSGKRPAVVEHIRLPGHGLEVEVRHGNRSMDQWSQPWEARLLDQR